jgi:hypothetical protein
MSACSGGFRIRCLRSVSNGPGWHAASVSAAAHVFFGDSVAEPSLGGGTEKSSRISERATCRCTRRRTKSLHVAIGKATEFLRCGFRGYVHNTSVTQTGLPSIMNGIAIPSFGSAISIE